jgi:hypothetical protein
MEEQENLFHVKIQIKKSVVNTIVDLETKRTSFSLHCISLPLPSLHEDTSIQPLNRSC